MMISWQRWSVWIWSGRGTKAFILWQTQKRGFGYRAAYKDERGFNWVLKYIMARMGKGYQLEDFLPDFAI